MLIRVIIRSVWFSSAMPSVGAGVVVQVPTQCLSFVATIAPPYLHSRGTMRGFHGPGKVSVQSFGVG
jgi:hypothetical protein